MTLRMIKPIDVIKKYIGSIIPSIEPIFNPFYKLLLIYYCYYKIFLYKILKFFPYPLMLRQTLSDLQYLKL